MVIKDSPINGKGVFANRNFAPNEVIIWNWQIDVELAVYLNHSCTPTCYTKEPEKNTWINDRLLAGPNGVKNGQEITFDYRKTRWLKLWKKTVEDSCSCPAHKK
jgi:SET domain-containing protein